MLSVIQHFFADFRFRRFGIRHLLFFDYMHSKNTTKDDRDAQFPEKMLFLFFIKRAIRNICMPKIFFQNLQHTNARALYHIFMHILIYACI